MCVITLCFILLSLHIRSSDTWSWYCLSLKIYLQFTTVEKLLLNQKPSAFVVQYLPLIKWWIRTSPSLCIFVGGSTFAQFFCLYFSPRSCRYHLLAVPIPVFCETHIKASTLGNNCKQLDYMYCGKTLLPCLKELRGRQSLYKRALLRSFLRFLFSFKNVFLSSVNRHQLNAAPWPQCITATLSCCFCCW